MQTKKQKILITGGAGYIGSVLAKKLCIKNDVVVVDDLSAGLQENLPADVRLYAADITGPEIDAIIAREAPDCIYHLAASKSVNDSIVNSAKFRRINVEGSKNVINSAIAHGVARFIFTSTAGVYGDVVGTKLQSEDDVLHPSSPYAETKLEIEKYILEKNKIGFNGIIMRFANVYGFGGQTTYESVINIFIKNILGGIPIEIHGDGSQTRDFIHIEDLLSACELLLAFDTTKSSVSPIFNIGSSRIISINELISLIKSELQSNTPNIYKPNTFSGQKSSVLSGAKAMDVLGWTPAITLEEGIKNTIANYTKAG